MALDRDRAAAILVDAAYLGDPKAAERWKITTRTIENYRARLKKDPELSAIFAQKRQAAEGDWKSELARALRTGVRRLARMLDEVQGSDLEAIEAVTGAVKALSEIDLTREVLNAGHADAHSGRATQGASLGQRAPIN
ncbi:MAG TPA: hypothetical protein VHN99_11870 [Deinococcales bacterium]|nr:hypothetical protein [Deinococcales bacterium]